MDTPFQNRTSDPTFGGTEDRERRPEPLLELARERALVDPKAKRSRELLAAVAAVERATAATSIRVAVCGEVSAGKSTFVNALLGRRLFASAAVATTAVATALRRGRRLGLEVEFDDGRTLEATPGDFEQMRRALDSTEPKVSGDAPFEALVRSLTCEPTLVSRVQRLRIEAPLHRAWSGTVLFDTPGIGSGAPGGAGHTEVTAAIVTSVADAAIVLIPAAAPLSRTLLDFLDGPLRPRLHRCLFLVAAEDRLTAAERVKCRRYVAVQLGRHFGLAEPPVFGGSALAALPEAEGTAVPADEAKRWKVRFRELELDLAVRLRAQRRLLLDERVARRLACLGELLEGVLVARRERLHDARRHHRAAAPPPVEDHADDLVRACVKPLRRGAATARREIEQLADDARKIADRTLARALESLDAAHLGDASVVEGKVREALRPTYRRLRGQIVRRLGPVRDASAAAPQHFAASIKRLVGLGLELGIPTPSSRLDLPAATPLDLGTPSRRLAEAVSRERQQRMVRSAAAGVGIGLLLGPLAAVAAAVLAATPGSDRSAHVSRFRTSLEATIAAAIADRIEAATTTLGRFVHQAGEEIADLVALTIAAAVAEPAGAVALLRAEHAQREAQLVERQRALDAESQLLDRLRTEVEERLRHLQSRT